MESPARQKALTAALLNRAALWRQAEERAKALEEERTALPTQAVAQLGKKRGTVKSKK